MVIMFGVLTSTALNMVVVQILYEWFRRPVSRAVASEAMRGNRARDSPDAGTLIGDRII